MQRTRLIMLALVLGIVIGTALRALANPSLTSAVSLVLPLGRIWIRALQMTLIPLIFAMVAQGVIEAVAGGRGGRLIGTTLALFAAMLVLTVVVTMTICETAFQLWPLAPNALAGLGAAPAGPHIPSVAEQLLAIIPDNPVAAAAQGQIFPLVVFAISFGLAIAHLAARQSNLVIPALLKELAQAMMTIVDWVLLASPIGIFLLALGMALNTGLGVAQVLAWYVGLCVTSSVVMIGVCYGLVLGFRAMPIGRFAGGIAPAQATAAGTCSSMATTPVMIEVAMDRLGLPEEIVGLVIPMAVSVFRTGTLLSCLTGALVAAAAAGIAPTPFQLLMAAIACMLGSIAGAGVPAAAVVYVTVAPALQLLGAPLAIIPLYIAVVAIADPIVTMANVSADLTAATLVRRLLQGGGWVGVR